MFNRLFDGYKDFLELRQKVMAALDEIDMSYGCKSYEGTFELMFSYPCYFDEGHEKDDPDAVLINLHCYVLGPARHYTWKGKNVSEAVKKCKRDIEQWIDEELKE